MEKYQKLSKIFNKLKNGRFYQKNDKIRDSKMLKTSSSLLQNILLNLKGDLLAPEAGKTQKITKIFKRLQKIAKVSIILCLCV